MILAYGAKMEHPGPAQIYMSKAPGSVQQYMGDGDWFKIKDELVCGPTAAGRALADTDWCTWGKDRLPFNIPKNTPPGEYLIRAEHIGLHRSHVGETEFYYACAQVKVTGSGNGTPGPLVKFPGAYKATDPGIAFSIWEVPRRSDYPYIVGPKAWDGGAGNGSTAPQPTSAAPSTAPTTLVTSTRVPATTTAPSTGGNGGSGGSGGAVAAIWQQCGGINHTGPTACATGLKCTVLNPYYSQCLS